MIDQDGQENYYISLQLKCFAFPCLSFMIFLTAVDGGRYKASYCPKAVSQQIKVTATMFQVRKLHKKAKREQLINVDRS